MMDGWGVWGSFGTISVSVSVSKMEGRSTFFHTRGEGQGEGEGGCKQQHLEQGGKQSEEAV
jgi:hypothetical protein